MSKKEKITAAAVVITEADRIWKAIKGLELELFALPAQQLEKHATRFPVSDDAVHLRLKSQAVLPALEEALKSVPVKDKSKVWDVSQTERFVVVRQIIQE